MPRFNLCLLLSLASSLCALTANAGSGPTPYCLDRPGAYERDVLAAMRAAKYQGITLANLKETNAGTPAAYHDPEFDVTTPTGEVVHVSCDDSGDDDCACSIDNSSKASSPMMAASNAPLAQPHCKSSDIDAEALKQCPDNCFVESEAQFHMTTKTHKDQYFITLEGAAESFDEIYVIYTNPGTCEVVGTKMVEHQ